jgi:pentatricopeptide repeat protein
MLNGDFRRRSSTDDGPPNNLRSSFNEGRGGGGGDRGYNGGGVDRHDRRSSGGDDRGRGQVIMGLDVQALVDKLCRPDVDVFHELDLTKDEHSMIFQSGKAVTAIISNLARRRKLKLALTVWDWIDAVGIEKNTFHYNSMISVCEKVRDYHKALNLLDEMKRKNVAKNEVT